MHHMGEDKTAGLLVLHGNRLELLADAVFTWLASSPLAPLEQETVLVPSNGMAEWFKMALAGAQGVCASTAVELPARFVWRAYRAVLGRGGVPATAPLDKLPLTWRLMQLLPGLAAKARVRAGPRLPGRRRPVATAAAGAAPGRPVRPVPGLSQRLARGLGARPRRDPQGGAGRRWGRRCRAAGPALAAALWRALQAALTPAERDLSRAGMHRRLLAALQRPPVRGARAFPDLPRRIVLFGTTHIPHQTLQAIAALSRTARC
jgi:exodeoxyribonuclease V gamma subunit